MRSLCPVCGRPEPCGCGARSAGGRLGSRSSRSKRTKEQERARSASNPWRSKYSSRQYREARQAVLSATGGRCAVTGRRIADWKGGRWVMRRCGGVHHKVPLSQGGTNRPDNLVPLHVSVHNRIDAALRRRRGESGLGR